jgi:cellulose synthase/poly-beta-1,6-N-acetylglucosamine synthase-like glycosyltransferase
MIIVFHIGWNKLPDIEPNKTELPSISISVLIPCKNEQENIAKLITIVLQQTYQNFELILINDHSIDSTREIIENIQKKYPNIQFINALGFGKKNALKEGILKAKGELIVTTDADCSPTFHWLETIVSFQTQFPTDLLICPVRLSNKGTFFSKIPALEFASLVGVAAGSAGAGMPVLCNGANLSFKKSVWLKCQLDLHEEEQSGDDMFLLESVKKRKGIIRFLKSESAFVKTKEADNLVEFIKQRRRWASKSTAYTDIEIILTAIIVFSINLLLILLIGFSIFEPKLWLVFFVVFGCKYLVDALFLHSIRTFFQLDRIWLYSLLLSLLYPFYIVYTATSAIIIKPVNWK